MHVRRLWWGLIGLALLVIAGCAGGAPDYAPPRVDTSVSPAMPGARLPAGATPVSGQRVDAVALPASEPRLVWTTGDGSTLGLYGEQGPCLATDVRVTAQTTAQVTITLVEQQANGDPCRSNLRYQPLTVALAQPLGDRSILLLRAIEPG
ncbi:MAG TPA: hypothetical protein VG317_22720 [Pseudonocardiaceae bacterium]|jgi:hypothetical protein|nr:hypothetical protein [Pseudonocardiaceae bacterium]